MLDGWWIEGHIERFTGWSIGPEPTEEQRRRADGCRGHRGPLHKLENIIIPKYYSADKDPWARMMKNAISKNAYYFNSHRMMRRYVTEAYIR